MKSFNIDNEDAIQHHINGIVENLSNPVSYRSVYHRSNHDVPMPSIVDLKEIVDLLRSVLFPGYFSNSNVRPETIRFYLCAAVNKIFIVLTEQIKRGFCFICSEGENVDCVDCELRARRITQEFIEELPRIRYLLSTDVAAAYEGDPAAKSFGETIFCYPNITTLIHYRTANALYKQDVPLIPRIITEMAHSTTGIDIHPGAEIDENFFIDHGTGVVIGETCIIGKNVRIYQGVTLGAKSFPLDKNGLPIKGIPRHPIIEDNVIIYSDATLLGRITIGKGSVIGGNIWLTRNVPPGTQVLQSVPSESFFERGSGI